MHFLRKVSKKNCATRKVSTFPGTEMTLCHISTNPDIALHGASSLPYIHLLWFLLIVTLFWKWCATDDFNQPTNQSFWSGSGLSTNILSCLFLWRNKATRIFQKITLAMNCVEIVYFLKPRIKVFVWSSKKVKLALCNQNCSAVSFYASIFYFNSVEK